ncbi:MAG: type II toxin-antitoxin system VapC family toxin [Planctomycetaceae bacterium]|nr:type II toxin-antitoxin system VapC family toxin [Planctomycetaceae bacterium]
MKYVLDSSVAFKVLVVESDSDRAKRLIEDYRNGVHELIAPDIFPIEVGHALSAALRVAAADAACVLDLFVREAWYLRLLVRGPLRTRRLRDCD